MDQTTLALELTKIIISSYHSIPKDEAKNKISMKEYVKTIFDDMYDFAEKYCNNKE